MCYGGLFDIVNYEYFTMFHLQRNIVYFLDHSLTSI